MALSEADWRRLDSAFTEIKEQIRSSGSKIHQIDKRLLLVEEGSPHKCAEAVQFHERDSWSHNPKKALGLGISIVGIIETIRAFFHK